MIRGLRIVLTFIIILAVVVVALPKVTNKETCTYEEAVRKYAKGKLITVDGKRVHYIEKGEGKPVILLHGWLFNTLMWKGNIPGLAEKHKVYAIDLWGWGFSERLNANDYCAELYGRQVVGFMDALNIQKATLAGCSMGGGVSVYVAAHYPDRVDRLILIDAAVIPYPMPVIGWIYQQPYIGEFLNAIPGDALMENNIKTVWFHDGSKATKEYTREVLRPLCIKGSYAGLMHVLRDFSLPPLLQSEADQLAKLNKPILIIHGREDKGIPLDRSQALKDLWKGSKLVIFDKARHGPHIEYPEKFNKVALEFLSQ
jgi:pimeloyl-ACP methyl ester carboxylesterase